MEQREGRGNLWSIVLAGGDGERTQPLIRRRLGREKPKQYCRFGGSRSMFQRTIDRATRLTPGERVVVVAARHHQEDVWGQLDGRSTGMVLLQPGDVDTAAGIFVPLTFILARDPDATVVLYPADHHIYPEERFLSAVEQAVAASKRLDGRPVLLGAKPGTLEPQYGWIEPGPCLELAVEVAVEAPIRSVEGLLEKPDELTAGRVNAAGGLWNTMVVAAGGRRLWDLGWMCVPAMMHRLDHLKDAIDTGEELRALDALYESMACHKFSSHLLGRALESLAVMEMKDVMWSDWNNAARIADRLDQTGRQPLAVEGPPLPFLYQG